MRDFELHVEGEPLFRTARDIVQLAAHVPQECFGLLEGFVFLARKNIVLDEIGCVFDVVEIFADPIERLQIAEPAFAFLDIGFDEIAAFFALPQMPLVALGKFRLRQKS